MIQEERQSEEFMNVGGGITVQSRNNSQVCATCPVLLLYMEGRPALYHI